MTETTTDALITALDERIKILEKSHPRTTLFSLLRDCRVELDTLRARLRTAQQEDETVKAVKAGIAYQTLRAWEARVEAAEARLRTAEQERDDWKAKWEPAKHSLGAAWKERADKAEAALAQREQELAELDTDYRAVFKEMADRGKQFTDLQTRLAQLEQAWYDIASRPNRPTGFLICADALHAARTQDGVTIKAEPLTE